MLFDPVIIIRGRVPKHIKNKEAITFFLLNENAPNFGRAEGMGRK